MKTIEVNGRTAILDIQDITPDQGAMLAEALAKVLVKTGGLADGVRLTGPHLIQFAEEIVEHGCADTGALTSDQPHNETNDKVG